MRRRLLALIVFAAALGSLGAPYTAPSPDGAPTPPAAPPADFNREVLPILAGKCFGCHGADAAKGGVRLHTRELATRPTSSGTSAVEPGSAARSEAIRRIFADADGERMPPPASHKVLTAAEKDLLRRWVDEGAAYARHWAFVAPEPPPVPAVKDGAWVRNEVDAFVLHRLESAGIRPSPRAGRETLVRRLSLDLRGLPPTVEEVDRFLSESAVNPQAAYAELVDRVLASPHYGEKMAQLWLDLARFGDTSGYHQDSTRQMWLWRDGVIEAFNRNQRFDQFTVEQLAGDLLPGATVPQKIASGFNRNTRFNEEGGVDPEEYVVRYNVDRTNTLGQVWLGLTLGCAECHSHKYDLVSQKEYYQLFAFFTGIKEPMVSMNHNQPLPPLLKLPTPEQERTLTAARKELTTAEAAIRRELGRVRYHDPRDGDPGRSQLAWEAAAKDEEKLPADVRSALNVPADKRDEGQGELLREHYLRKVYEKTREVFQALEQDAEQARRLIGQTEEAIPYTLVSEEMDEPRAAYVLRRGDFQQKGERVSRGVPAFLPPLPDGTPANRLALARWLVRADHPLTARVTVNRLWAQMFGTGIVRSLGDLGTQGDAPSHPELLDWLATEFVRSGWDVKAVLKLVALSNTYQQSSVYRSEPADPHNRLLYRAPRFRLSAEEVRDCALAAAGLLSRKVGGPPVMPYQPADYYKGKYEHWPWAASGGGEQYRRGLYTFWRRTSLHPMFAVFDAPTREECVAQRPRTNTPLQALVTLNDPTFVEAARVFAERVLTQGPEDTPGRIAFAFRTALSHTPTDDEVRVLADQVRRQHERFRAGRESASKLVHVGSAPRNGSLDVAEHAAWTVVAGVILNLDEMVMRE